MSLISCEINLILTWSANFVISEGDRVKTFTITDTKCYVPVVTLSTQDNTKLLQQLKSGFKRTVNWNKYPSEISKERPSQNLDYLVNPSFQVVNRVFVLPFEDNAHRISYTGIFVQK